MAEEIRIQKKQIVRDEEEDSVRFVSAQNSRKLGKRRMDSTQGVSLSHDLKESTPLDQPAYTSTASGRRYCTRRMHCGREDGGDSTEGVGAGYVKRLTERYAVKRECLFNSPTQREGVQTNPSPVGPSPQNRSDLFGEMKPSGSSVRRRLTRSSIRQSLSKVTTSLCMADKVETLDGQRRSIRGPVITLTEKVATGRELGGKSGSDLESVSSYSVGMFSTPQEVKRIDGHSLSTDTSLVCPEAINQANLESLSPILEHRKGSLPPESTEECSVFGGSDHDVSSELHSQPLAPTIQEMYYSPEISHTSSSKSGDNMSVSGALSVSSDIVVKNPATNEVAELSAGLRDSAASAYFVDDAKENCYSSTKKSSHLHIPPLLPSPLSTAPSQAMSSSLSAHLSLVSPPVPKAPSVPFQQDIPETTPISPPHKQVMVSSSSNVLCPTSVGQAPLQFNPLPESTSVEAVLSGIDHTMFDFDSDIISLLDEVPDTIAWDTPLDGGGTASDVVKLASGTGQEVQGVVTGESQCETDIDGKHEMKDVVVVESTADFGNALQQASDNASHLGPVGKDRPMPVNLGELEKAMADEVRKSSNARGASHHEGQDIEMTKERQYGSEMCRGTLEVELEHVRAVGDVVDKVGGVMPGVLVGEGSIEKVAKEEVERSDGIPNFHEEMVTATLRERVLDKGETRAGSDSMEGGESEVVNNSEGKGNEAAEIATVNCASVDEVKESGSLSAEDDTKTEKETNVRKSQQVQGASALRTLRSGSRASGQSSANTSTPMKVVGKSASTRIKKIVGIVRHGLRLRARSTSEESAEVMALSPAKKLHVDTIQHGLRLRTRSTSEESAEVMALSPAKKLHADTIRHGLRLRTRSTSAESAELMALSPAKKLHVDIIRHGLRLRARSTSEESAELMALSPAKKLHVDIIRHGLRLRARSTSTESAELMALSPAKKLHVDTIRHGLRLRTRSTSEESAELMALSPAKKLHADTIRHGLRLCTRSTSAESAELMALSPAKKLHVNTGTPTGKRSRQRTSSRSELKGEEVWGSGKITPVEISAHFEGGRKIMEVKEEVVSSILPSCDEKASTKTSEDETSGDVTFGETAQVGCEATNVDNVTVLKKDNVEKVVLKSTEKLEVRESQARKISINKDVILCDAALSGDMAPPVEKMECVVENKHSASIMSMTKKASIKLKEVKTSEGAKGADAGVEMMRRSLRSGTKSLVMKVDGDKERGVVPVDVAMWVESVEKDMAVVCGEEETEAVTLTIGEVILRKESCKVVSGSLSRGGNLAGGDDGGHTIHMKDKSCAKPTVDYNIEREKGVACDMVAVETISGTMEVHNETSSKENGEPNAVTRHTLKETVQQRQLLCPPPLLHVSEGECVSLCLDSECIDLCLLTFPL